MKRVTRLMLAACLASLATPALADAFADAHRSIVAGDVDSAMLGIAMGAFAVNAQDETGNTLLHYAAQIGSAEAVAALLDRGADPAMRTHRLLLHPLRADRDVLDPRLSNAPCSFTYEAIFGWLPWLLMGQRPGHLSWRATGLKLPTLGDLPAASRAGFERTFPTIFTGGGFGPGGGNLWERFKATREPAAP